MSSTFGRANPSPHAPEGGNFIEEGQADRALWPVALLSLALTLLQLLLFLPALLAGNSPGWAPGAPALALVPFYRADALALAFGVVWSLSFALPAVTRGSSARQIAAPLLLILVGGLAAAYAGNLTAFWLGWEVAGLGLWLALSPTSPHERRRLGLTLHAPGWILLVLAVLPGSAFPLVPPAGGAAQVWSLPVTLALGAVALARSGCWPFQAWVLHAAQGVAPRCRLMLALYMVCAPYILARALVAARWDAVGAWSLVLLGTLAFMVGSTASLAKGDKGLPAATYAGTAIAGFGLATSAPLAAAGAVVLLLAGVLAPALSAHGTITRKVSLLVSLPGLWAISQAALTSGYGLVATALLPAWVVLALPQKTGEAAKGEPARPGSGRGKLLTLLTAIAAFAAVFFPQLLLEYVLRPVIGAMPGGVGALFAARTEWGLGVLAVAADSTLLAAWPATGIAVALGLALVTLYWLQRLGSRLLPAGGQSVEAEGQTEGEPDSLLPAAGQIEEGLDPAYWAARLARLARLARRK